MHVVKLLKDHKVSNVWIKAGATIVLQCRGAAVQLVARGIAQHVD